MNEHSIIPPSSAYIWGAPNGCTGWVVMAQTHPEGDEGDDAKEGTASHELASYLINDRCCHPTVRTADKFTGKQAANGIIFTDEMYDGAKIYADDVGDVMLSRSIFGGPGYGNEKRLIMPSINEHSFGTTDHFLYDSKDAHLFVWDYKFGFETVEVFENWQTINYIPGIIKLLPNIENWAPEAITVHIRIVQPRAHHRDGIIREWITTLANLQSYFDVLKRNAAIALSADATINTGSHCKHCQARHDCPALLKAGPSLYEVAMKPLPAEISPEAMGVQLAIVNRAIDRLSYLSTGLTEQVKSTIKNGAIIPNFKLEQGYGRLAWSKSTTEVLQLGKLLDIDLAKPDNIVTPKQAIKLGVDETVIKAYSGKPKQGLKVVPDDGKKQKQFFT